MAGAFALTIEREQEDALDLLEVIPLAAMPVRHRCGSKACT